MTLDRHEDQVLLRVGGELAALPDVPEAYLISGAYDYPIKVAVQETAGYERFLRGSCIASRGFVTAGRCSR